MKSINNVTFILKALVFFIISQLLFYYNFRIDKLESKVEEIEKSNRNIIEIDTLESKNSTN